MQEAKKRLVVRGLKIALFGCAPRDEKNLLLQFQRLGIEGNSFMDFHDDVFRDRYDSVIFDSDNSVLIKQISLGTWPSLPKIALMGLETPSRLSWVIDQEVDGCLRKPVKTDGILSTIILARHHYERHQAHLDALRQQDIRIRSRRFLLSAQIVLMREFHHSEQQSYELLRRLATEHQQTVEEFCIVFLSRQQEWLCRLKSRSVQ
ncbi:antitermination regulator [Acerihabitans sp.]|uniref:ANTAR domain-containing response regulator n=1 Tax=Acerihabitans sp. TaxID=2811394 RepID=UPI002EDAC2AB